MKQPLYLLPLLLLASCSQSEFENTTSDKEGKCQNSIFRRTVEDVISIASSVGATFNEETRSGTPKIVGNITPIYNGYTRGGEDPIFYAVDYTQ